MVAKTSIYYDIVSEYNNKGQLRAETGLAKLSKSALSLAKTYGVAFSGAALVAFGVKAVKVAAEQDKAFKVLGNTLKNLGLEFASSTSKSFIENLALSTGTSIDALIPAYQNLLTATNDVALSQSSLKTAMDVSAATGKDLVTVTQAMAKGYLGNTTGLMRLGAGLDKALVKTGRMDLIMKQLSNTFRGGAATAADTAAGAMARLSEAARLATVQIGEGLLYAFNSLSSGSSVTGATSNIVSFGKAIGDAIKGVGDLITKIKGLVYLGPILGPLLKGLGWLVSKTNPELNLVKSLAKLHASTTASTFSSGEASGNAMLASTAQAKALAAKAKQLAAEKAILSTQKAQTLEQKQQALLKLIGSPSTDLEKANLMAALQHQISAEAKAQIQYQLDYLDLQSQTGTALQATIDKLLIFKEEALIAQGKVMLIDGSIVDLATAKNPFEGFDAYVQGVLSGFARINQAISSMPMANFGAISGSTLIDYSLYAQNEIKANSAYAGSNSNTTVTIIPPTGWTVQQTQDASANGSSILVNRTTGTFGTGY